MSSKMSKPNSKELDFIATMSRSSVVTAYSDWKAISQAEQICIDMAFRTGCRVLDLGCGAGRFANLLGKRASAYLGVDASAEMIEASRKNYPHLTFLQCDITELNINQTSWDLILLMGNVLDFLQPLSRRATVLSQCVNWLSNDGKIIGSSHLTKNGQSSGYYCEDYHGANVENYRASFAENISEAESYGLEVMFGCRDYRGDPADWCYWVALKFNR